MASHCSCHISSFPVQMTAKLLSWDLAAGLSEHAQCGGSLDLICECRRHGSAAAGFRGCCTRRQQQLLNWQDLTAKPEGVKSVHDFSHYDYVNKWKHEHRARLSEQSTSVPPNLCISLFCSMNRLHYGNNIFPKQVKIFLKLIYLYLFITMDTGWFHVTKN